MKRRILTLASSFILSSAIYAQDINIQNGWQLLGATEDINVSKFDNSCIDFVWKYDTVDISNPQWQVHIANGQNYTHTNPTISSLQIGEGFWVKGNDVNGCDVNTSIKKVKKTCIITNIDDYHQIDEQSIQNIAKGYKTDYASWNIEERQDLLVSDTLNCLKEVDITDISFVKAKYSDLANIENFNGYPNRNPTDALIVSINLMSTQDFQYTSKIGFNIDIYIDEDNNPETGYKVNLIGAEGRLRSSYGFYPKQPNYSRFNNLLGKFEKYSNDGKYISGFKNYDKIGLDHDTLYIGEVAKIMPISDSYSAIATISRTDSDGNSTELLEQTDIFTINPFKNNY